MPNLTSVSDFPPWSIDYNFSENNAVVRSSERGFKRQADYSHRKVTIASAVRHLYGAQLPYFESFIRTQCNDGQLAFTDKYKDGGGVTTGTVRLVDGAYVVTPNGSNKNYQVSCSVEIFR